MSQFMVALAPISHEAASALRAQQVRLIPGEGAPEFVRRMVSKAEPQTRLVDWWFVVDEAENESDTLFVEAQGADTGIRATRLGRALVSLEPNGLLLWYASDCNDLPVVGDLEAAFGAIEEQLREGAGEVYLRLASAQPAIVRTSDDPHAASMKRALLAARGTHLGDCFGERFFGDPALALDRIEQRTLPPAPWPFTDDTAMAAGVLDELARGRGAIDPDALARTFAEHYRRDPGRGYGGTAHGILTRIGDGESWSQVAPSVFSGMGSCGNGGAMRAAPIGGYHANDLAACVAAAKASAAPTHAHPEGAAGAIAVALAAAHAASCGPAGGGSLLDAVRTRLPAGETRTGLLRAKAIGLEATPAHAAAVLGTGQQLTAQDTVPFTLWCAARSLGDLEEALWITVAGLGDRDTTCAIVGGIVALAVGKAGLPAGWMERCEAPPWGPAAP